MKPAPGRFCMVAPWGCEIPMWKAGIVHICDAPTRLETKSFLQESLSPFT